jgi:serine/threonine-protein kinase
VAKLPAVIGRYQILDRIGQGGMGSLFLAWDPMLERQIAIKLLRDDNEELRERFAREARSVAKLRHRNIVTIFDVGEQDGQPFIAMEYIQGQTLGDLIRSGAAVHVVRKLQLIDELCDGLGFAHRSGIVHRDVKPANVMVEHEGAVKILDFGIARIAESGMTQAGMLIGTLNYMSPEQVAGRVVDMRSDIFAVGAVLYELLACKQAFPGGLHNGILNRILHEPAPPLKDACPDLDLEVIQIVEQALEKDPQNRYQDLSAMRRDLQRAQQRLESSPEETVALRPPEPAETIAIDGPTMPPRRAQTPRRGTDREGLARRRASQIAAHLEQAHQALAAEDFEGAVAAAEQALLLDAEEADAIELLDRARAGLDERQAQELLSRGEELLRDGDLTRAMGIAEQALTLTPGSPIVLRLRDEIDRARESRARERERAEALERAMEQARTHLHAGDFDQAEAAAEEALKLAPDHADARTVLESARKGRARREQEELDRRAAAAVQEADRLFQSGRAAEAISALEGFTPAHPQVASALTSLRQVLERIERERREAKERADKIAAAIAAAAAAGGHDQAIAILDDALKLDPAHAELKTLLSKRRAARNEEIRLAKERSDKIANALAQARKAASHEAAIEVLQSVLAIEPSHGEASRLLGERQAALEKEREAARLARERAQAIAAALEQARTTAPHEAAIAILQKALTIDGDHTAVRQYLAERESALNRERTAAQLAKERAEKIAGALASARRLPAHAEAIAVLEEALKLDPAHAEVKALLTERRAARDEEVRQARERRDKIAAAVAKAAKAGSHEAAIEALEVALAIEPGDAEVRRLLTERQAALAREREAARLAKEREQAIAAALAEARAAASHETAIGILRRAQALDRNHSAIREQLAAREAAFEREQAEARRARELAEKIAAAVASAKRTPAHDAALTILEDALKLDPANADVKALITQRRAARDEEVRQARERREKAAALVAKAKGLASHEAAIEALESALALEPADPEIKRLLGDRQATLAREKEAARLAKERAAAVAAAIARAAKTDSHEAAVEILEGALKLEPANTQVQKLLGERKAARDRQREEERKAAERREKVATAIKKAKAAASHEAAIAALKEALALEPDHREARTLYDSRTAALEKERAEAKRLKDIETARQTIAGLIGKQQFDAADAALKDAEAKLQVGKTFKDLKKQLAKARAAAGVPAGIASIEGRPGLNIASPAVLGGIAAAVLAVVAAGYFMMGSAAPESAPSRPPEVARSEPSSTPPQTPIQPPQQQPAATPAQPPSTSASTSDTASAPSSLPETSATPPPAASPTPNPEPAPPPAPTAPAINPAVDTAIKQGRQQLARDPRRALQTIVGGLKVDPKNVDLRGLLDEVVKRARQDAQTARTTAMRHGQNTDTNATFREATKLFADAGRTERSSPDAAAALYWQAANLMNRADTEIAESVRKADEAAKMAAAAKEKATPPPEPVKPVLPNLPTGTQTSAPGTSVPSAPLPPPPAPAKPPATTAASGAASPGRGTATPPPAPRDNDQQMIRDVLRAYENAYSSLNAEAVRQIFPSVPFGALKKSFSDLRAQSLKIDSEQIEIKGDEATVNCQIVQSLTPRNAGTINDSRRSQFSLRKQGGRWIIVDRR